MSGLSAKSQIAGSGLTFTLADDLALTIRRASG